jgi:hypothetical protein
MQENSMNRMAATALAGALALPGCSGEGGRAGEEGWVSRRDTLGDTIVVRTLSGSVWGAPARLAERVSIGVADGAEELMLGNVRAIAVGSDGTIHVLEGTPVLKQFTPSGEYIRMVGRLGSGPGEYRRPDGGLAVLSDGRIVVRDPGNGRLATFASDGTPLETWRISSTFNTSRKLYRDSADNVYTLVLVEAADDPVDWKMGVQRVGPDGSPGDSIAAPHWSWDRAFIKAQREGSTSVSDVPFSPEAHWSFSPLGYMVGGLSTAYRVDVFRPEGTLRIERDAAPVPVAADEASDLRREATEEMRSEYPGWTWNGPDVPATKPPFREVFVGEDGRIWIVVSSPGIKDPSVQAGSESGRPVPAAWSEPVAFDVFEPDGRYLGAVATPSGFLVSPEPIFRGDTVWATAEDADGVRYVKRYEVTRDTLVGR